MKKNKKKLKKDYSVTFRPALYRVEQDNYLVVKMPDGTLESSWFRYAVGTHHNDHDGNSLVVAAIFNNPEHAESFASAENNRLQRDKYYVQEYAAVVEKIAPGFDMPHGYHHS